MDQYVIIIIITQMELVWKHSKMAQPQVYYVLLTIIYFNNLILGQTERLKSLHITSILRLTPSLNSCYCSKD